MEEEIQEAEPLAYKKYIAEMIGTFVLVLIGCGSAVIAGERIGFLGISFAFGLAVLAMVYAIGPISGCHINPAITVAMWIGGKIKSKDAAAYIVVQIIGAMIAAAVLWGIASGMDGYSLSDNGLGQNFYGQETIKETVTIMGEDITTEVTTGYTMAAAFAAEVVLTFIFLMVIFGATSDKAPKGFAGLAIGLALAFIHMVGIPITGTSVNPARSIGPAVFVRGDALSELWLFIVAPLIGAAIAALVWRFILEDRVEKEEEEEPFHGRRHYHGRHPHGREPYQGRTARSFR
ncbi:MAG: aquaporin Z [Thermoplasmatota archaeon]